MDLFGSAKPQRRRSGQGTAAGHLPGNQDVSWPVALWRSSYCHLCARLRSQSRRAERPRRLGRATLVQDAGRGQRL